MKELGVREDEKAAKNQGYWKFILTLKYQTATREENLEVVKQKWKQHPKTNSSTVSQIQTADKSFDWQEICRTMLEKHKRLTTNEFLFADEEMKFELEEIYVPLALVERNKPSKCREDILAEQGALVEFDDGCGEFRVIDRVKRGFYEFRAYFLAAAGVDEWKNSCKADAIVAEIVKWGFGEFKVEQNKWVQFLRPIPQGARTVLPQTNRIKAIAALVESIGNPQLDDSTRWQAAESLGKILAEEQMPSVVTALKDYLSDEAYENKFQQFNECYQFIWKCAQSMPYRAFYQAWHQQEKVKDGE